MTLTKPQEIAVDILEERRRQDELKASGRFARTCADLMTDPERLAVLAEEFGEVARCVAERVGQAVEGAPQDRAHLREELIQVAAVCLAWVEGLDVHG